MSAKPETNFYNSVLKYIPLSQLYREKMANPYRGGTPDHWFSGVDDFWVEWKFIVVPKRDDTLIDVSKLLSPLQLEWIERRHAEYRTVIVIVGCKEGGVVFQPRELRKSIYAGEFRRRIESRQELARTLLIYAGQA